MRAAVVDFVVVGVLCWADLVVVVSYCLVFLAMGLCMVACCVKVVHALLLTAMLLLRLLVMMMCWTLWKSLCTLAHVVVVCRIGVLEAVGKFLILLGLVSGLCQLMVLVCACSWFAMFRCMLLLRL